MSKNYIVNIRSRIVHRKNGCHCIDRIKPENKLSYYSLEEAELHAKDEFHFDKLFLCNLCFDVSKDERK